MGEYFQSNVFCTSRVSRLTSSRVMATPLCPLMSNFTIWSLYVFFHFFMQKSDF